MSAGRAQPAASAGPASTSRAHADAALPRVTYSAIGVDFTRVHERLDEAIAQLQRSLPRECACRVGGERVEGATVRTIASPIDERVPIARSHDADEATVGRAIALAREAQPAWRRLSYEARIAVLRRVIDAVSARKFEIAAASVLEVGKSQLEAIGEVEEAIDVLPYYEGEIARNDGYARALGAAVPQERTRTRLVPYGVFAVIGPFNYPVAVTLNMMFSALLMGNTVIYKPSPGASLTASMLDDAFAAAGVPSGVLQVLLGGDAVGERLVAGGVDGAVFTGSTRTGLAIRDALVGARGVAPVIAEMGGKNATVVAESADLDVAAEGLVRSAFGLSGQKCSSCELAYVHERIAAPLLERLLARTGQVVVGDPRSRATFMGPLIDARAGARMASAVQEARAAGASVHGGQRLDARALELAAHGQYVRPALVTGLAHAHRLAATELFLPWISIHPVRSFDEGLAAANASRYGLTAGLYSGDETEIARFLDEAQAGVIYLNRRSGATTGAWPGFQTFGGWKLSGTTGKNGFGPHYLPLFAREQSSTQFVWR